MRSYARKGDTHSIPEGRSQCSRCKKHKDNIEFGYYRIPEDAPPDKKRTKVNSCTNSIPQRELSAVSYDRSYV